MQEPSEDIKFHSREIVRLKQEFDDKFDELVRIKKRLDINRRALDKLNQRK